MPRLAVLVLAVTLPGIAFPHTGPGVHADPFLSGFSHPLSGPDHLLAMLAVGLLAALTGAAARLGLPAAFLGGMALGAALGFGGAALPVVESVILASVVVLGAAVALAIRPPLLPTFAVVALFGAAHGYAHGVEGPALGGSSYAIGFVLATAALHGIGLVGGLAVARGHPAMVRALGGLACLGGLALAAG